MMAAKTTKPIATTSKTSSCLAVDHAEDDEHEDEGADELGRERLGPADGTVLGDTEAHVAGLLTQNADDRRRPEDRTGQLRAGHVRAPAARGTCPTRRARASPQG